MLFCLNLSAADIKWEEDSAALRIGIILGMTVSLVGDSYIFMDALNWKQQYGQGSKIKSVDIFGNRLSRDDMKKMEEILRTVKILRAVKFKSPLQIKTLRQGESMLEMGFNATNEIVEKESIRLGYPPFMHFMKEHVVYIMPFNTQNMEDLNDSTYVRFSEALSDRYCEEETEDSLRIKQEAPQPEFGLEYDEDDQIYGVGSGFGLFLEREGITVTDLRSVYPAKAEAYSATFLEFPMVLPLMHGELKETRNLLEAATLAFRKNLYAFSLELRNKGTLDTFFAETIAEWFQQKIEPEINSFEGKLKQSKYLGMVDNYYQRDMYFETKWFVVTMQTLWNFYKEIGLAFQENIDLAKARLPDPSYANRGCLVLQVTGKNIPEKMSEPILAEKRNLEI